MELLVDHQRWRPTAATEAAAWQQGKQTIIRSLSQLNAEDLL